MLKIKNRLKTIYGNDTNFIDRQFKRIQALCEKHRLRYGNNELFIISTPGRSEIGGNHTDHNNGRVIAAGINLDTIGVVSKNDTARAVLYSDEFQQEYSVEIGELDVREEEFGSTSALIRGILRGFKENGYTNGGFTVYMQSDIKVGSGLSSSACVEVLLGTVLNELYNDGEIEPVEIARIGQYAENVYFGKPCGLMDQIACAYGGIVSIDFIDDNAPEIEKIELDLKKYGYSLLIVHTGNDHASLTAEYAAVPEEMRQVAMAFGKCVCRGITKKEFLARISELRQLLHERPILRALHFIEENERVEKQIKALREGKFYDFLSLVNESGNSSFKLLQNIYSAVTPLYQPITLGLSLTERFISSINEGAVRIHGGGFAGTYQVFLPSDAVHAYRELIEPVFGFDCITELSIRPCGSIRLS